MPTLNPLQLIPRKLGITEFDSLSTLKNELPRCNCEIKIDYCSTDGQLSCRRPTDSPRVGSSNLRPSQTWTASATNSQDHINKAISPEQLDPGPARAKHNGTPAAFPKACEMAERLSFWNASLPNCRLWLKTVGWIQTPAAWPPQGVRRCASITWGGEKK